jgi:calcineurin-like phosphoesterase family protein
MKTYLISDPHLNHDNIATYCQRPADFTQKIDRNVKEIVKPEDILINLGDIGIGKPDGYMEMVNQWPGRHILVRGNHDQKSCQWYMNNGFDFACDGMIYRGAWLTHKPSDVLPPGTSINIHGHLHNIWHGFHSDSPEAQTSDFVMAAKAGKLAHPWQRLFAVEYTDYKPVEFDKFVNKPDRYQARGPKNDYLYWVPPVTIESVLQYQPIYQPDPPTPPKVSQTPKPWERDDSIDVIRSLYERLKANRGSL